MGVSITQNASLNTCPAPGPEPLDCRSEFRLGAFLVSQFARWASCGYFGIMGTYNEHWLFHLEGAWNFYGSGKSCPGWPWWLRQVLSIALPLKHRLTRHCWMVAAVGSRVGMDDFAQEVLEVWWLPFNWSWKPLGHKTGPWVWGPGGALGSCSLVIRRSCMRGKPGQIYISP